MATQKTKQNNQTTFREPKNMLIETHQEGIVLSIRAFPGAKRNEARFADDCLKIYVTQIPEKGKANEAIRKQLIQSFGLRASQVELLQGKTSAQKRFLIRNISSDEIQQKIAGIAFIKSSHDAYDSQSATKQNYETN
jgi:uncharacterized protein (TIGR00251 family)